jgi:hypothetical protein
MRTRIIPTDGVRRDQASADTRQALAYSVPYLGSTGQPVGAGDHQQVSCLLAGKAVDHVVQDRASSAAARPLLTVLGDNPCAEPVRGPIAGDPLVCDAANVAAETQVDGCGFIHLFLLSISY